jgi:hypothetical protein
MLDSSDRLVMPLRKCDFACTHGATACSLMDGDDGKGPRADPSSRETYIHVYKQPCAEARLLYIRAMYYRKYMRYTVTSNTVWSGRCGSPSLHRWRTNKKFKPLLVRLGRWLEDCVCKASASQVHEPRPRFAGTRCLGSR